jgi:DNA polymerase III alpha subunit
MNLKKWKGAYMINISLQTEFSFKQSFLHMKDVHKFAVDGVVGVADFGGTFGHIQLEKESKKHGFKPLYGVRLFCLPDDSKQRSASLPWIFIAKNKSGLKRMYQLVQMSYSNFYYIPRVNYSNLTDLDDLIVISPIDHPAANYFAVGQGYEHNHGKYNSVAVVTNNFPLVDDRVIYELLAGARKGSGDDVVYSFNTECYPQHIMSAVEWNSEYKSREAMAMTYKIAEQVEHFEIPKAGMVHWNGSHDITQFFNMARVESWDEVYQARLDREMALIAEKDYTDYFLIVADLIKHAKKTMLVGPARGSSAGSLVCYLMGITDVDPIKYDLIFERFIDVNRHDLPDIDIDFPDVKREAIVDYLKRKYGENNVRCLANINRLKAKSAIGEFAKALRIPAYETSKVKDAIIERSSGDARAAMCIADTFESTEAGQEFIAKYPSMSLVSKVEGHASHAGKHAAGILVSTEALSIYGSINLRDDVIQMDKKDAEYLGLLKVDCLGLRTLSILEGIAGQLNKPYSWFNKIPLDDKETFRMMTNLRLTGIFQFEGNALQIIVKQMGVNDFNDIVAITALARPGALNSGGTARYIKYSTGAEKPDYYSDIHHSITGDTYGIVVYQEQMMNIARQIGGMSWEDTSDLRRAASKSMGDEFFARYKDKFVKGAIENGYSQEVSEKLWVDISASGSWSFNKSHAVSYGLVSYWTAYCKCHFPGEFAVACLDHATDSDNAIKLLRDLVRNEGFTYNPVDADKSQLGWSVSGSELLGGLMNIKGIGIAKAKQIINARSGKAKLTPSLFKMLSDPKTELDILFPAEHYFGFLYKDPVSAGLDGKLHEIVNVNGKGEYLIIGRLIDRNLRDLNEQVFLEKRGGSKIDDHKLYINFKLEDDTDMISCKIGRYDYEKIGRDIAEKGRIGKDWYLVRGTIKGDWRTLDVSEIVNLNQYYKVEV